MRGSCIICGESSHLVAGEVPAVCRKPACRWTFDSTPVHARCTLCARPLPASEIHKRICSTKTCRETEAARRRERERQLRELDYDAFVLRSSGVRATVAEDREPGVAETYSLARIPRNARSISPLPRSRSDAYAAYVLELTTRVFALLNGPTPVSPTERQDPVVVFDSPQAADVAKVLGNTCGLCRGKCCGSGDTQAYLTEETIARYIADHPEAGPDDVVAAYVSRLPAISYTDACVNQSDAGCVLAREMRSTTCNGFYCTGLLELIPILTRSAQPKAFVEVSVESGYDYAFVDAEEVRRVPPHRARATV